MKVEVELCNQARPSRPEMKWEQIWNVDYNSHVQDPEAWWGRGAIAHKIFED